MSTVKEEEKVAAASTQENSANKTVGENSGRRVVPVVCPGHNRPVVEVHFADTKDGLFHIAASLDSKAMLRNGETGDWIGTFEGHKGAVWSAKLNSTATNAATGAADFSVKLWDAITGEDLKTWNYHRHIVKSVAFSYDGKKLLSAGRDKKAYVFDIEASNSNSNNNGNNNSNNNGNDDNNNKMHSFDHPTAAIKAVWCGEQSIMTGAEDGILRIWDLRSNEIVKSITTGTKSINDIELSYDHEIVTVAAGKKIQFIDTNTYEIVKEHTMQDDQKCVSLRPDRKEFLTAAIEKQWVYLYDYETGKELNCKKGHHGEVLTVRYSPSGESYTSGAHDATLRLWKME
jgi:serine-threonine kinase receptor-associated protein